ncbi:MAG: arsenate reductase ArsC [Pseudomonadota bacterium]
MTDKIKILFLCTGNSCRSQMAEAWTRALKGKTFDPYSAGVVARGVDPLATQVMLEAGIDISKQESKNVDTLKETDFDYVVTLCSNAQEACPFFPARTSVIHVAFDDPPALATQESTEEAALKHYRRVREEIRTFVNGFPETLKAPKHDA